MEHRKINYRIVTIIVLLVSILLMSIGYAIRSSNLVINGTTTIGENVKWDVHIENVKEIAGGIDEKYVYTPASIIDKDGTYVVYDIKLPKKGDYYEFTFDVVNKGTIDAKVSSLIQFGSEDYEEYLHYDLSYVDGDIVYGNDSLNSGETSKMKIRVTNIYETNDDEIIDKIFNLSLMLQYVQK